MAGSDWTDTEKEHLRELIAEHGTKWKVISTYLPGRTATAAKVQWRRLKASDDHPSPLFDEILSPEMDADEWIEHLGKFQSLYLKAEPHQTTAEIKIPTDKPIAITFTSCWHVGGLYTFYEGFKAKLDELLETDRLYWGVLGDEYESFPAGWANTVFLNLVAPHLQRRLVAKIIDKIHERNKLLFACWSNHPAFQERQTGEDMARLIYEGKVPYFQGQGVVVLKNGQQSYILDVAHGFPGKSMYNPNHPQMRELREGIAQADIIASGHTHNYGYQEVSHRTKAYDAGLQKNLVARLVQVGTAKQGPDPYTMRNFSSRGVFIWPTFVLSGKQHEIHRVYDRESLNWYLNRKEW